MGAELLAWCSANYLFNDSFLRVDQLSHLLMAFSAYMPYLLLSLVMSMFTLAL